jgi:hypothetical protein
VPVSALEQALQVAVHAVLQQKPLTQKPLAHWLGEVHALPWPWVGRQVPVGPGLWQ